MARLGLSGAINLYASMDWTGETLPLPLPLPLGTAVAQWLRCCATNRKVAGSISAGVIGIFH